MYKVGDPIEKDRFKSPILNVQELYLGNRINFENAPSELDIIRGVG
jgi:hypothetical protein